MVSALGGVAFGTLPTLPSGRCWKLLQLMVQFLTMVVLLEAFAVDGPVLHYGCLACSCFYFHMLALHPQACSLSPSSEAAASSILMFAASLAAHAAALTIGTANNSL